MPGYRKSRRSLKPLPYSRQYLPPLPGNFAPWQLGMHHLWYPAVQPYGGMCAMFQHPGLPLLPYNYFTVSASQGIMHPYLMQSLSPYLSNSLLKEDCTVTQLDGNVENAQESSNFYQSENKPTQVTVEDETIKSDSGNDSDESGIRDNGTESCVMCREKASEPCKCDSCTAVCCFTCIDEWLKSSGKCPVCRSEWDNLIEPEEAKPGCVICLDKEATKPCKCEICTAVCCYICIDEWLTNSSTCPMCRSDWDILIEPL